MNRNDPNANLPTEALEQGVEAADWTFRRCLLSPVRLAPGRFGSKSLVSAQLADKQLIVYVRVTLNDDNPDGTGEMPWVLVEAAIAMGAEPHVIRVHLNKDNAGVGYSYYGHEEFVRTVKDDRDHWNAHLLGLRSTEYLSKIQRGRVSTLQIEVHHGKHNARGLEAGLDYVWLSLRIDGQEPWKGAICPTALMESAAESGEHFVFTCGCGYPECIGIEHGVIVARHGNRVFWKSDQTKRWGLIRFDYEQYRAEILTKCGEALARIDAHSGMEFGPHSSLKHIKETFERISSGQSPLERAQ